MVNEADNVESRQDIIHRENDDNDGSEQAAIPNTLVKYICIPLFLSELFQNTVYMFCFQNTDQKEENKEKEESKLDSVKFSPKKLFLIWSFTDLCL